MESAHPGQHLSGDIDLEGRIAEASNATFLGRIGDTKVVYKPLIGEKPLWDFPDRTLANREVAAYELSEFLGWNVVPTTWLRDGPFGTGMVQLWQESDPEQEPVTLIASEDVPTLLTRGWRHVLDGLDEDDNSISLLHEGSTPLRHMALFDILTNNADRKGGHILAMPDGHRYGVDHGLTFHTSFKLRTVLWGWIGEALNGEDLDSITAVREGLDAGLGETLGELLTTDEVVAVADRCELLLKSRVFPPPQGGMPAVPWPLF